MTRLFFVAALLSAILAGSAAPQNDKLSVSVREHLASPSAGAVKVWIYFTDRGLDASTDGGSPIGASVLSRAAVSDRAVDRRLRRSSGPVVDERDLPPFAGYVGAVRSAGCRVRHQSKYLNAVSAFATPQEILALEKLSFVRRVDRVKTARREIPDFAREPYSPPSEAPRGGAEPRAPMLDYGASYGQLNQIGVIALHDANVHGEGVLVAMLDTGFNRSHESLVHLDVVAEWDFINDDPVTKNEPGDPASQHNHGTYTLSALAGYAPGDLIGPAWAASFALGKTERVDVEIQSEEDDYVRGLEWADSLGADLVSTSLGYYDWYTYEDMDGNTAVTTIAADIAASKGLAVITAAGNMGPLPWPGIIAPSDGDSVIAVGAVDFTGAIASFSSRGPSYDGRIKPDVCAQGVSVRCASPYDSLAYLAVNGTSLSTPLVGGAAALCLQMHPYWSPVELRDALRASASQALAPNNDYGWGIINTYLTALNGASAIDTRPIPFRSGITLRQNSPNPFVPSISGKTVIGFRVESPAGAALRASRTESSAGESVTLAIYDVSGRLVRRLFEGRNTQGDHAVEWNGLDDRGVAVSSSVYYYRLSAGGQSASKKLVLIRR
jgi:serine protease AprX